MVPILPIVAGVSFGVGIASDLYSQWKNYQYQKGVLSENERFWKDYIRNTGVKPRYPYRSGMYQNSAFLYSGLVRTHTSIADYGVSQYRKGNRGEWLYR